MAAVAAKAVACWLDLLLTVQKCHASMYRVDSEGGVGAVTCCIRHCPSEVSGIASIVVLALPVDRS